MRLMLRCLIAANLATAAVAAVMAMVVHQELWFRGMEAFATEELYPNGLPNPMTGPDQEALSRRGSTMGRHSLTLNRSGWFAWIALGYIAGGNALGLAVLSRRLPPRAAVAG